MRHVIRNLLWAGGGALLAWIAMSAFREVPRSPSGPVAVASIPRGFNRRGEPETLTVEGVVTGAS